MGKRLAEKQDKKGDDSKDIDIDGEWLCGHQHDVTSTAVDSWPGG